ncbi:MULTISPECIES: PQQ-binding-like beta-propeller repeat protein [Halorussus]|uniref:outer membrane protein assembly factor BamB family protein n=1 Tax=Halorussus TaxID=1070314 RepID=UPI0020A069E0|nr:PQQ-binding-like beta-propeller repeat protein [Halorussus vallis]USZ78183.1 PQQ-binding-like beta-propeller repeat protein [Halorussus vallis]
MPSRRRFLAACGASVALAGCVSFGTPDTDGGWPRRAADVEHTAASPTTGPTRALYEVWHRDRPDRGGSTVSPVVGGDRLYLAYSREARDRKGGTWLEAFDAATGETEWTTELWRTDEFHYFYHSDSLVLDGDRVFVQTKAGLKAVGADGTPRWTFDNLGRPQPRPNVVPPAVTDGVAVTGTYGSVGETSDGETKPEVVFGVDPATGRERWRLEFPDLFGMWQLSAAGGVVYVPFFADDGGLVALDVRTGEELWRRPARANGPPSVAGGRLFLPLEGANGEANFLAAFDAETGERLWRRATGPKRADNGLAVANGLVYLVADFGLEARRVETGERVWRFDGRNENATVVEGGTTPAVAGDAVYVNGAKVTDDTYGRLFVLDAATGAERARFALGENRDARSAPAVVEGLAFVNTNQGRLVAVGECETEALGRCLVG